MTLYKNKYRVESTRLSWWDYTRNGYYFTTICIKNKLPFFGKINSGIMVLSEIGKIVEHEWLKTEQLRDNVRFDEWIIMPNHIHGVIIIERPYCRDARRASPAEQCEPGNEDACHASLHGEQKIIIQNL